MATDEKTMIEGLNSEGKVAYRQWHYSAGQLATVLATYASIGSTQQAKTAIERAMAELTKLLDSERTKWQQYVDCCIAQNADYNLASSNHQCQHVAARDRLSSLDSQLADALLNNDPSNNQSPGENATNSSSDI